MKESMMKLIYDIWFWTTFSALFVSAGASFGAWLMEFAGTWWGW
jgi:hypothetical protein